MKLPAIMLSIDRSASDIDFTAFIVAEFKQNPKNLSVDMFVLESILKDYRNLSEVIANEKFEKEKERLIKKYNIPKENIL